MDFNEFFPTLPRDPGELSSVASIELQTEQPWRPGQLQEYLAMLLNLYTCSESPAFAYFAVTAEHDGIFDHSRVRTTDAKILYYQALSQKSQKQVAYRGWKPLDANHLELLRVNTALIYYTDLGGSCDAHSQAPWKNWNTDIKDIQHTSLQLVHIASSEPKLFMRYTTESVPPSYAASIARTLEQLMVAHLDSARGAIGWLELASKTDRQYLLGWNPSPKPSATTVHAMVRMTVQSNRKAEAVCAWDGRLSYGRLDDLACILANRLKAVGVRKGMFVPFAFEKSFWAVVVMLGILKSGAAFVALDPTQPMDRLSEMLQMLDGTILVTSELQESRLRSLNVQTVVVPRHTFPSAASSQEDQYIACSDITDVGSNDPALVLFSSGSTGRPKAMVHEHGSMCSNAIAVGETAGYHKARVLQFSAYIWDAAIMDIFITLIFGGCVCIPSEEDRLVDIARFMERNQVDLALLTPSYARSIEPESVPNLKTLILGGECPTQEDVRQWAGHVTLMNAYGPAEVWVSCLNESIATSSRSENIGFALPNSPCWLVNPDNVNQLVPIGATGELVVGGPNLAREYLHQLDLTQGAFIVDPAWAIALGLKYHRFYRTGDLLRYNMFAFDGSFDFMGRKDDQVKLRGQRIEPGEIEYHLCKLPGVKIAIVTVPRRGHWKNELVAVVQVTADELSPRRSERMDIPYAKALPLSTVQGYLSKYLPSYMIPTACVALLEFPRTVSMKINRREVKAWLEEPENLPNQQMMERGPPPGAVPLRKGERTALLISSIVENYLCSLNEERTLTLAGYDFTLREAGLDSIKIIRLFAAIRKLFGDIVSFPDLLRITMTVRNLAKLIDDRCSGTRNVAQTTSIKVRLEYQDIAYKLLKQLHNRVPIARRLQEVTVRNVLITGCSGYLGRQILRELLNGSCLQVYVLMRCAEEKGGLETLKKMASMEGWWQDEYLSRLVIWPGDLTQKGLGLCESNLSLLHGQGPIDRVVNGIIHCGAVVHYTLDYDSLRQANVISTVQFLEATAVSRSLMSFVFITGGRLPTKRQDIENEAELEQLLWNGYSQSKYVAERVITTSNFDPVFEDKRISIVSPGYIIGARTNGRANKRDFIWKMIAGCIEIGAYNEDETDRWLCVLDVAGVSRIAINALSCDHKPIRRGNHYPVMEGIRFHTLWKILQTEFGYRFDRLPGEQWLSRFRAAILKTGETHALFPLLPALETIGCRIGLDYESPNDDDPAVTECLRENISYLIRTGFFPGPLSAAVARK